MRSRFENLRKLLAVLSRPSHVQPILIDLLRIERAVHDDWRHCNEAMRWLCRAQDAAGTGGVSGGYYPTRGGWLSPYPETTGYIIPTFLAYAAATGQGEYRERALWMGDWEVRIQLKAGAVRGGIGVTEHPIVFNTGQVILGWNALYRETGEDRYLECAVRAGEWLASVQDDDGKWTRHAIFVVPHAYHARVAWPLLELHELSGVESIGTAARRNIEWVLAQANKEGWFRCMGFDPDGDPLTHTIAYTLRGLIESWRYLAGPLKDESLRLSSSAAEGIMMMYERRKPSPDLSPRQLPAELGEKWRPKARYSCVTGNAQMAIVWMKLYRMNNDARYLNAALKILDQVKASQSLRSSNGGVRGAVPGRLVSFHPHLSICTLPRS
jgi:hypothetical protein